MNIDSIKNGIVIDHIGAKKGMEIYEALRLKDLDCAVAIITNAKSEKDIDIDMEVIGFIEPNATINIVKDNKLVDKYNVKMPEKIVNIAKCQNPRCITSIEKDLDQIFTLTDKENQVYRCKYCEMSLK